MKRTIARPPTAGPTTATASPSTRRSTRTPARTLVFRGASHDPRFVVKGELKPWQDAMKLVYGNPPLEVVVASAFAAPLVELIGSTSVVLSVYSAASGVGKTTAMMLGAGGVGRPAHRHVGARRHHQLGDEEGRRPEEPADLLGRAARPRTSSRRSSTWSSRSPRARPRRGCNGTSPRPRRRRSPRCSSWRPTTASPTPSTPRPTAPRLVACACSRSRPRQPSNSTYADHEARAAAETDRAELRRRRRHLRRVHRQQPQARPADRARGQRHAERPALQVLIQGALLVDDHGDADRRRPRSPTTAG